MRELTLPTCLAKMTASYTWKLSLGHSQSATYRLQGRSGNLYLKFQPASAVDKLESEKDRLIWLQGKLPVPEVVYYDRDEAGEYLLTTEVEGLVACDSSFRSDLPGLYGQLAAGLRQIHEVSVKDCPFDQRLAVKLEEARCRTEAGFVDEEDFDACRQGMKAGTLLQEALDKKPATEDVVFTHGDYCLPNVILRGGRIGGFIDVGRAGIADRYQDLALAARSIVYNFGDEHLGSFWQEYGIPEPDEAKLEYYQLLDEFF